MDATETTDSDATQESVRPRFVSKLTEGPQRFLAYAIENAFAIGRRNAIDFIRHFPPAMIMDGLRDQARLRASILVLATGIKERIALKQSAGPAAELLQISLDEGETDPESVVMLFQPDDRVRYLDAPKLWQFLIEGEFWNASPSKKEEFERAKEHVAFMLDRALEDKLLTHRDIVDGISVEELVTRLPKAELGRIIRRALDGGHQDQPFKDDDLMHATPSATLVRYVPLSHVWRSVIEPHVAHAHAYAEAPVPRSVDTREWMDSVPSPDRLTPVEELPTGIGEA